jgi:hypothetical protein
VGFKKIVGDLTSHSTDVTQFGQPGEIYRDTNGKEYRLVKCGASIPSSGNGCILQLDSVSGTDGYTVEPAHASSVPVFGFNKTGASISAGEYFWAQVKGPVALDSGMLGAALADQKPIGLNSAKKIVTLASNAAVDVHAFGHTIGSIASNGSGTVYVACRGD